jgi:transposase
MAGKRIDSETRQKVLEASTAGLSMRKTAERFGISATSVGRIIRESSTRQSTEIDVRRRTRNAIFQKKVSDIERRLAELEKKILEHEARKRKGCQER